MGRNASMNQDSNTFKQVGKCARCKKYTAALYDLTPVELSNITPIRVCQDCYQDEAYEWEQDGYHLDLGA